MGCGSKSYYWATRSLGALVAGAWLGAAALNAQDMLGLALNEDLLTASVGLSVGVALYCLVMLYRHIPLDAYLGDNDKRVFRAHIILAGPVGALEVYLWFRRRKRQWQSGSSKLPL